MERFLLKNIVNKVDEFYKEIHGSFDNYILDKREDYYIERLLKEVDRRLQSIDCALNDREFMLDDMAVFEVMNERKLIIGLIKDMLGKYDN